MTRWERFLQWPYLHTIVQFAPQRGTVCTSAIGRTFCLVQAPSNREYSNIGADGLLGARVTV